MLYMNLQKYRNSKFQSQQIDIIAGKTPMQLKMGSRPSFDWGPSSIAWFATQPSTQTQQNTSGFVVGKK